MMLMLLPLPSSHEKKTIDICRVILSLHWASDADDFRRHKLQHKVFRYSEVKQKVLGS